MSVNIPADKISEIKNTADIVDVISEAVLLKKAGRNHKGLCPFHSEKTPSFTVSSEKQMFYCFGCSAGGDVFEFLQKHEGVSFIEAVQALARRYGITIPHRSMSLEEKKRITEKDRIFDINKHAMNFFNHNLMHGISGKKALDYLENRGLKKELIDKFSIGFVPDGWDNLLTYFRKKSVNLELVEKSGLIVQRNSKHQTGGPNRNAGYYDRFRNRIIFPILDAGGNPIGFGGRVMDQSLPKYLNSPETPVYNKSASLYGLNTAKSKCRNSERVFVVEGYMDLLTLYQYGIKNVVSTLGTALTSGHVRVLKGHIGQFGKVVLVYDSDEAGINAAKRSIGVFDKENVDAYILELPEGHDPDSYLLEFGHESFVKLADKALSTMLFLVHNSAKKHGNSIEGNIRIISDMIEPLLAINDGVKRFLYIKELSERTGIDETAIMEKIRVSSAKSKVFLGSNSPNKVFPQNDRGRPKEGYNTNLDDNLIKMEKRIIAMMLQFPAILSEIKRRDILGLFINDNLKSIGNLILNQVKYSQGQECKLNISEIVSHVEKTEHGRIIASLSIEDDLWDHHGCLKMIDQFTLSRSRRKNNTLIKKIKAAEENNDHELLLKLLKEKQVQVKKFGNKNLESAGGEFI